MKSTDTDARSGMPEQTGIEYVIEPSKSWFQLDWRELFHYRDLLFLLVRRDFISRYKQTILGPAWFVLQPLITTLVFTIVFGKVARIPTDGLPEPLFYLCGLLAWNYFAQCMGGTSTTFVSNAGLFGKVYFPRLIIPFATIVSNIMSFLIQLVTFLCFWLWFKFFTSAGSSFHITVWLAALPGLFVLSAAIGLGVGLWMSALTAKYRDFMHLSGFLTQVWMFATPVIYPLSCVPQKWQWVSALNPMTCIVEVYKYAFLGTGTIHPLHILVSVSVTFLILVSGLIVFSKIEKTFIDTV
jgi:lipopolysaccharide transport system permease protein